MQDDQLLRDLRSHKYHSNESQIRELQEQGVITYSQLFALLANANIDTKLRGHYAWLIGVLSEKVDRRKAVPYLLKALTSTDPILRSSVCSSLGMLNSKRAVAPLLKLLEDRSEAIHVRLDAVRALCEIKDGRAITKIERVMFDPNEDIRLRAQAVEWFPHNDGMLDIWIGFLSDQLPDLRFWAAFRLAHTWEYSATNFDATLVALDRVAAYDHTLPQSWGWHVDREALSGLEDIYSRPYRLEEYGSDEGGLPSYAFYLISPTAEYDDFIKQYRRYNPAWLYEVLPEPPTDLKVDPDWLKAKIVQAFPQTKFNVRQPKPQTYLLDWHLQIDGQNLLGGLHRDQYALVLTGKKDSAYIFASWYRSIISPEYKLYIYEWADTGIELIPGVTTAQIAQAEQDLYDSRSAPAVLAKLSQTETNE